MQVLNQLLIDENNIAFHPSLGNSYQLNPIGSQIVNLIKQYKTTDEIIDQISSTYDISKEELFIDLSDFITKLKVYGLVV
jgi:hypothetical protein